MKIYLTNNKDYETLCSKINNIGIDYEKVYVPKNKKEREELEKVSGQRSVPTLEINENEDRQIIAGKEDILNYLEENYQEKSWKRKKRLSDIIYHIIDGIIEFF